MRGRKTGARACIGDDNIVRGTEIQRKGPDMLQTRAAALRSLRFSTSVAIHLFGLVFAFQKYNKISDPFVNAKEP